MADRDRLESLRESADAALAGVHADEALRRRILRAAEAPRRPLRLAAMRLVPAACAAAAVLFVTFSVRGNRRPADLMDTAKTAGSVTIPNGEAIAAEETDGALLEDAEEAAPESRASGLADEEDAAPLLYAFEEAGEAETGYAEIAAGVPAATAMPTSSPLPESRSLKAAVRSAEPDGTGLFAAGSPEIPVLAFSGRVYRLLTEPEELKEAMLGETLGAVQTVTEHPSLASREELLSGLSDCCDAGGAIRAVADLPETAALAAPVGGRMRLFQRVSYAGLGETGALAESLCPPEALESLSLSGGGTLSGDAARAAYAVLLSEARLSAQEAEPGKETLILTLSGGLRLQMTVSGDTLIACGAWRCPGFLDAFGRPDAAGADGGM